MKNKDQPINPTPIAGGDNAIGIALDSHRKEQCYTGLTKREYFAGLFLQSLADDYQTKPEYKAQNAIEMADALLKELEN